MVRALPGCHHVFIDIAAAIDDHEVEQLTHQIERRADSHVGDQLAVLDPLGRREQIDPGGMLAQRRFELNRIELLVALGQRHDGAFGLEIEQHREPARLQIEIDQRHPLA